MIQHHNRRNGHLSYTELGNKGYYDVNGNIMPDNSLIKWANEFGSFNCVIWA